MQELFKEKVDYNKLSSKEQEAYNFAKTAAVLAEYGFECCRITADKHGADMIAYHINTTATSYSIQLKGSRPAVDLKYSGKNIYISYIDRETNEICIYNHDEAVEIFKKTESAQSRSWKENGGYCGMILANKFKEIIIRLPM